MPPWLERTGPLGLVLTVLSSLLLVAVLLQAARLRDVRRRFNALAAGRGDRPLEALLDHHLARIAAVEQQVQAAQAGLGQLQQDLRRTLRKVGLVRFDAFGDVSGEVSFALAVLNEDDQGWLLSSLYHRDGSTVYAKPITQGRARVPLSDEEQAALDSARRGT
ncbi:MAG: DUF4446 family protein [Fimbriimonadaceae bacterium]|nr:DUF4446 family protein [Fimbriimonadaceae bacterium]